MVPQSIRRVQLASQDRVFLEAVLYVMRTGIPWRDLPLRFGNWNSVYRRFARWSKRGVWNRLFADLAKDAVFEELYLDSTIVRAHQHAAGAPKNRVTKLWGVLVEAYPQRSTQLLKGSATWPNAS